MKNQESSKVAMNETSIGIDTPMVVSQISDNCLYSGFYGRLDSARMKVVTDRMINSVELSGNEIIIIDLSNVDIIDSGVAAHLIKVGTTLKLIGVKVVFCGIKSIVAQTMAVLGVEFEKFELAKDLKSALNIVYEITGLKLVKKNTD